MKTKIIIASAAMLFAGLSATFTACSPDYETNFDKSLLEVPHKSQALITFQREGGEHSIDVKTNVPTDQWQALSNAEWCKVEKQDGKVKVTAGEYDKYQTRKAVVNVRYGHQSYNVQVIQLGYKATIELATVNGMIKRKRGFMTYVDGATDEYVVPVATNLNIDHVIVPDTTSWVHFDSSQELKTDAQGNKLVKLKLDANKTNKDRYCTMTLQSSQNWDAIVEFVLIQCKAGYKIAPCYGNMPYNIEDLGGKVRIPYVQDEKDGKWTVTVSDDAAQWLSVNKKTLDNKAGEFTTTVKQNLTDKPRTGIITMKSENNNKEYRITINQDKFKPVAPFNVVNVKTISEEGKIKLTWDNPEITNYTRLVIKMHNNKLDKTVEKEIKTTTTTSITFDKTFKFAGEYEFTIMSYGPTNIATNTPVKIKGTSKEWSESVQIELTKEMITANATQDGDGGGIPALVDGNINTYYHSLWKEQSSDKKPHRIQIQLKTGSSHEFYFDYDGRNNGDGGGDVVRAKIYGSTSGVDNDEAWEQLGVINYELPAGRGQKGKAKNHIKTTKSYSYLRFVPLARRNKDPLGVNGSSSDWFNMSELRLWEVHDENWAQKHVNEILTRK